MSDTWKPQLTTEDISYVNDLLHALEEVHSKHGLVGIEPINIYSEGDPLGYIDSKFTDKKTFFFVAGDRYSDDS